MKTIALAATIVVSTLTSTYALTTEDIKPAALLGKTLTFKTSKGLAPLPTTGVWTATFSSTGNGLTVKKVSGNAQNITTTYFAEHYSPETYIAAENLVSAGPKYDVPAEIFLSVNSSGVGVFQITIADSGTDTFSEGTFTIGAPVAPKAPEISVKAGKTELQDGKHTLKYSKTKVGKSAKQSVITISNIGNAPLNKLSLSVSGKNKKDFRITKLKTKSLAAKKSVNFIVTFKPNSAGTKNALLTIKSSDADEGTFKVKMRGTAQK